MLMAVKPDEVPAGRDANLCEQLGELFCWLIERVLEGTEGLMVGQDQALLQPPGGIAQCFFEPPQHLIVEARVYIQKGNTVDEGYGCEQGHSTRVISGVQAEN